MPTTFTRRCFPSRHVLVLTLCLMKTCVRVVRILRIALSAGEDFFAWGVNKGTVGIPFDLEIDDLDSSDTIISLIPQHPELPSTHCTNHQILCFAYLDFIKSLSIAFASPI